MRFSYYIFLLFLLNATSLRAQGYEATASLDKPGMFIGYLCITYYLFITYLSDSCQVRITFLGYTVVLRLRLFSDHMYS